MAGRSVARMLRNVGAPLDPFGDIHARFCDWVAKVAANVPVVVTGDPETVMIAGRLSPTLVTPVPVPPPSDKDTGNGRYVVPFGNVTLYMNSVSVVQNPNCPCAPVVAVQVGEPGMVRGADTGHAVPAEASVYVVTEAVHDGYVQTVTRAPGMTRAGQACPEWQFVLVVISGGGSVRVATVWAWRQAKNNDIRAIVPNRAMQP